MSNSPLFFPTWSTPDCAKNRESSKNSIQLLCLNYFSQYYRVSRVAKGQSSNTNGWFIKSFVSRCNNILCIMQFFFLARCKKKTAVSHLTLCADLNRIAFQVRSSFFPLRFPSLMALVPPQEAAEKIVSSQRRNYTEVAIPGYWYQVNTLIRWTLDSSLERYDSDSLRQFQNDS